MNRQQVLSLYDREMRGRPYVPDDWRVERAGDVVRVIGHWCGVMLTELDAASAEAAIDAETAYFGALGREVEWKVHAHDQPADLAGRLAARGFVADPMETLLALDLTAPLPAVPAVEGLSIRQAHDEAGLADYVAAVSAGFEADRSTAYDEFRHRLADPTVELHVAYLDGAPIAGGRVDLPPSRPFAGLYSGGVDPRHRGRGVYRALVDARLKSARDRGYAFAMVEALPTSRPILERLGFTPLTTVQGWIWSPPA